MPTLTLNVTNEVATRLANASVMENPELSGASAAEKTEYVRQKIITLLKEWVINTEKDDLKAVTLLQLEQLHLQLSQLQQIPVVPPDIT